MKKILFGIIAFLGIGLSFCSADTISCGGASNCFESSGHVFVSQPGNARTYFLISSPFSNFWDFSDFISSTVTVSYSCQLLNINNGCPFGHFAIYFDYINNNVSFSNSRSYFNSSGIASNTVNYVRFHDNFFLFRLYGGTQSCSNNLEFDYVCTLTVQDSGYSFPTIGGCPDSSISVFYNNDNSTESVVCNGDNSIFIDGLSTITSTNTWTPYYNINYRDEDNQLLTESYSKDILYLSGGSFKKTYTGNNVWILNNLGISKDDSSFSGYKPVFDVTGSTQPLDTEYNMFNNFTDNSLKVLLSNIPSYFQYIIIFGFILFIIGLIKLFKRKK